MLGSNSFSRVIWRNRLGLIRPVILLGSIVVLSSIIPSGSGIPLDPALPEVNPADGGGAETQDRRMMRMKVIPGLIKNRIP
jgi:hypothetical protein